MGEPLGPGRSRSVPVCLMTMWMASMNICLEAVRPSRWGRAETMGSGLFWGAPPQEKKEMSLRCMPDAHTVHTRAGQRPHGLMTALISFVKRYGKVYLVPRQLEVNGLGIDQF